MRIILLFLMNLQIKGRHMIKVLMEILYDYPIEKDIHALAGQRNQD